MRGPAEYFYDRVNVMDGNPTLAEQISNMDEGETHRLQTFAELSFVTIGSTTLLLSPHAEFEEFITITNTETEESHWAESVVNRSVDGVQIAGLVLGVTVAIEAGALWFRAHRRKQQLSSSQETQAE